MSQEIISEVQEYVIMYTFNIVQKIKKWNDGKLKFFKFNNKVQLFNDDSILITSQFLQNDRQLQSDTWGTEFKIGSVLVTIEEMTSETSRDISNVFKRENKTKTIEIKETSKRITPLKDTTNSPSTMLKRRRVGLSKNMTPSKLSQRMTQLRDGDKEATPIKTTTNPITREGPQQVTKPDLDTNFLLRSRDRKKITPRAKTIPRPYPQSTTIKSTTLETPTTNKTTTKDPIDFDDDYFDDLESPSLIPSDKYFLLGPKRASTPPKVGHSSHALQEEESQEQTIQEAQLEVPSTQINFQNGEIKWDDESLTRSNTKIQNSLNSLIPSPDKTPISKPVKRITSNRSKRETIRISKPKIALSDISNKIRGPITPKSVIQPKRAKHITNRGESQTDSEFDEIESQSQSQIGTTSMNNGMRDSMGLRNDRITQTETYDYQNRPKGGYRIKVSEVTNPN